MSISGFADLRIGARLGLGFAAMVVILAIAVGLTQLRVTEISDLFGRIAGLRLPTSHASSGMVNDINGSLASLRGWMLTGNPAFKTDRAVVWENIDWVSEQIERLSKNWTNPENIRHWNEFRPVLAEFREAQANVEAIAHTADQFPATKILVEQASPQADIMATMITRMIDEEGALAATAERKALLGMMADVRGSLGLSLANIRAYLLTGDAAFQENFERLWQINDTRFADLTNAKHMLNSTQSRAYDSFAAAREVFVPLPQRMFEIRKSDRYDMANYLLVTEAANRADRLLDILAGTKDNSGHRNGGMVENQILLLNTDADTGRETASDLQQFLWGLLVVGAVIAAAIGLLISLSITRPVRGMTAAMGRLAEGDFSVDVPALTRRDEVGDMAKAVQVFKANGEQMQVMEDAADGIVVTIAQTASEVASAVSEQAATASEQAAAVSQTSASLEEIRQTADNTAERVTSLNQSAQQSLENGQASRQQMDLVVVSMGDIREKVEAIAHTMVVLSEQTRRVGEITDSVSALAQQSKMLAINASIEAAKAGEAGQGFAVVAEEVANLAEQSEQATVQVRSVLEQIQSASEKAIFATEEGTKQVDAGVELIQAVGDSMRKLLNVIGETAESTQQMVEAIRQQTSGIQQVSGAMNDITQGTSQIAGSATQIREALDGLNGEVEKLRSARG